MYFSCVLQNLCVHVTPHPGGRLSIVFPLGLFVRFFFSSLCKPVCVVPVSSFRVPFLKFVRNLISHCAARLVSSKPPTRTNQPQTITLPSPPPTTIPLRIV